MTIEGPDEAVVGQATEFVVDASGVDSWFWVGPDGAVHPDARGLEVTASTAGAATIWLVATSSEGERLEIDHTLDVTEE